MRRVFVSTIILTLLAVLVPSTYALFSTTKTISDNVVSTGVLALEVVIPEVKSLSSEVSEKDINANTVQYSLRNTGTLNILANVMTTNVPDNCSELKLIATDEAMKELYNGTAQDFSLNIPELVSDATYTINLKYTLNTEVETECKTTLSTAGWNSVFESPDGNSSMSKTTELKFNFTASQSINDVPIEDETVNNEETTEPDETKEPLMKTINDEEQKETDIAD